MYNQLSYQGLLWTAILDNNDILDNHIGNNITQNNVEPHDAVAQNNVFDQVNNDDIADTNKLNIRGDIRHL